MSTRTVQTPGDQSLVDFQTVVQQQEGIFGPLTALGKQGSNNTITLQVGPSPTNRAILETYDSTDPPAKEGYDLVCTGDCLVESQPAKTAAYRKV